MPGFSPSTRPTRSLGVAVVGNERSIQLTPRSLSYAEVSVANVRSEPELAGRAAPDDLPLLEDVVRVGDARQSGHVLVDDQDRLAPRLEVFHATPDLGADERREPFGRFVQDEQARVRHQCAPDREHLLLAAGERAAEAARTGRELRKQLEDELAPPRGRARGPAR